MVGELAGRGRAQGYLHESLAGFKLRDVRTASWLSKVIYALATLSLTMLKLVVNHGDVAGIGNKKDTVICMHSACIRTCMQHRDMNGYRDIHY